MVTIDSGNFPLIRNIDASKQPNRAKVEAAWIRMFSDKLPEAIKHLPDVVEDVLSYELWKDHWEESPQAYFESIGLFGLDLEEPAKLIKILRSEDYAKRLKRIHRPRKAKELKEQGMSVQEIANELGVTERTVYRDLDPDKNSVMTPKMTQRDRVVYQLSSYTKPETAATKIRDKFGDEFADDLKELL